MYMEHIYVFFLIINSVKICFANLLTDDSKYGSRRNGSFCVHPIYPCFYYRPCFIDHYNVNDLKILECATGLVFDVANQKCKWVTPWKSCLKLNIHNFVIKEAIIRKFLSNKQPATSTTTASTTTITTRRPIQIFNIQKLYPKIPPDLPINMPYSSSIDAYLSSQLNDTSFSYVLIPVKFKRNTEQQVTYLNRSAAQFPKPAQSSSQPLTRVKLDELIRYKKVCYYTNWSQYRKGSAKFLPENIDPFLCTHIIYAFAYIDEIELKIKTIEANDLEMYKRVNRLKMINPKLKTMLAIGGWNMESQEFSEMVRTFQTRRAFIEHALVFLRVHDFDGIDLDWEFPGDRGGNVMDKPNLTLFVRELRAAINEEAERNNMEKLLLSAAVSSSKRVIDQGYEVREFVKQLDWINLMAFDFQGSWNRYTGLNAPLYGNEKDTGDSATFNQDWGVNYWIEQGCPPYKLVLGLPAYGRSFRLKQSSRNNLYSESINGSGIMGKYTRTAGFLAFYEICEIRANSEWRHEWLANSKAYYMYNKNDWVSYDDVKSFQTKAAYVVARNLGGLFMWSIDMDDFSGQFCGKGKFPLLKNSLSLLMEFLPRVDIKYAAKRSVTDKRILKRDSHRDEAKNKNKKTVYMLKNVNTIPEQNMNQLNTIFESLVSNHYKDFVEINLP